MSLSVFPKLWPSAFPERLWLTDQQRPLAVGNSSFTLRERATAVAADLFRQLPTFAGAYVAASIFLSPADRLRFAILGVGCFVGSGVGRGLSHYFHDRHEHLENKRAQFMKVMEHVAYVASQMLLATFYVLTISRVVQQLGHAVSSLVLFKNPNPVVQLDGFLNGSTIVHPQGLTPFGKQLDLIKALGVLHAAGPIARLTHDLSILRFAHDNEERDPDSSFLAYVRVALSSVGAAFYAISSRWPGVDKDIHTYVHLEKWLGIHPITAAVFLIAAPLLYKLALYIHDDWYGRLGTRNLHSGTM